MTATPPGGRVVRAGRAEPAESETGIGFGPRVRLTGGICATKDVARVLVEKVAGDDRGCGLHRSVIPTRS